MKHIMGLFSRSSLTGVSKPDVQPNAVDLRLKSVRLINQNTFIIDDHQKKHRGSSPLKEDAHGYYHLEMGSYEIVFENEISVGANEAGWVITRSTLIRNGVYLVSGLYDTGYSGGMVGLMVVTGGPMKIKAGTRIGQYLNFESEALHDYDGDYGHGKAHDEKYKG